MLTHIDLFSGIGGFTLAAEWAGFRTVALCEINPYCQRILRHRFPGVPIISDVKEFTYERIIADPKSMGWGDGVTENQRPSTREINTPSYTTSLHEPTLTLLTASPPCQPVSVAGKRGGKGDDRWLWDETLRVLAELRPTWCCFENPSGIKGLDKPSGVPEVEDGTDETSGQTVDELFSWLDGITAEMGRIGYRVQSVIIPACAVNAVHRRDRVWIIGYTEHDGQHGSKVGTGPVERIKLAQRAQGEKQAGELERPGDIDADSLSNVAYAQEQGLDRAESERAVCAGGCSAQHDSIHNKTREQSTSVADTHSNSEGLHRGCLHQETGERGLSRESKRMGTSVSEEQGDIEPRLCSMDARVSERLAELPTWAGGEWEMPHPLTTDKTERVNRLTALGNAVVPQQAYPILKAIADVERQRC